MKPKKFILKYFIISMILVVSVMGISKPRDVGATSILTMDMEEIEATLLDTAESLGSWAKEWASKKWEWLRDEGIALAYKKALSYFLQQLAHDAAVYLATGDKGQSPMFYTENWGDYLANVGDNAVGTFLEELGSGGPVKFDLCDPGMSVTMKIGYGIMQSKNPSEPDCTYTEMKNNWEAELQRADFLNRFGNMFEPSSNDFGIALSLQGKVMEQEIDALQEATLKRSVNKGMKDVTDSISETIKTPSDVVRSYTDATFDKKDSQYLNATGHALADAIGAFTSTLSSTLMKELFKKGLSRSSDDTTYTGDWGGYTSGGGSSFSGSSYSGGSSFSGSSYRGGGGLTTYQEEAGVNSGISVAKEQFKAITEPIFAVKGDYEALNELVTCSNPTNAKTNECVMTENFRQAIENRMTVAEAATKKYINKDGVFGFRADGLEPNFNEGIPYRSMIIMRKYRIIPVGWELAAQYIMDSQDDLNRSLSLYDMIACFYTQDDPGDAIDRYQGYDEDWCRGLVDPSWVLKAPQNFCKREGAGPYVISSYVSGEEERSKLYVARDDTYCADDQTCIKEDDDGSCELYGYCTEDRRKYDFGGESCDSIYNTCQSFRAEDGSTIALLENTLDYGTVATQCTAENAGCKHFKQAVNLSEGGDGDNTTADGDDAVYNSSTDEVDWDLQSGSINLDYSAAECDKESEGCHEFIRTRSGLGANLLKNASFEDSIAGNFADWGLGTRETNDVRDGYSAIRITPTVDISQSVTINPYDISDSTGSNFDLEGSMFTLSAYARDCNSGSLLEIGANGDVSSVSLEAADWRLVVVTHTFGAVTTNTLDVNIRGADNCIIDAVKLEITDPGANGRPTRFTNYREAGLVYQKLIPAYLYESCYDYGNGDGFIEVQSGAPAICNDYARYCTATEVNCELYQSTTENFSVPAAVVAEDYCPADCVGYDEYQQTATNFEDGEIDYFIPDTANTCSAIVAGCDEFTNLDELDDPEAREYFVHLRTCIDPEDAGADCQSFFMWEGTDETGYQLLVHQLDTDNGTTISRADNINSNCSTVVSDYNYHADCREFYDETGALDYEMYYNTVSCTADCHPYRRTVMDTGMSVTSPGISIEEDNCLNYGVVGEWSPGGYCIYMGVPSEGISCQAEESGCREYNGNAGANTRIIFEHSFENGTNQGWGPNSSPSNTSVIIGEHSLSIDTSPTELTLGSALQEGKSYVLQFLAIGGSIGADITGIYFDNNAIADGLDTVNLQQIDFNINRALGDRWESYEVNLDALHHTVNPVNERLVIQTTGTVNLDNIRLIEVLDRHYLIEESWEDYCNYENADPSLGEIAEETFAGCDAYVDRDNMPHNLYQFNHLCSDSAVGCELMIDTHNYHDYDAGIWFDLNDDGVCDTNPTSLAYEPDCTTVVADSYVYAVYDNDKKCEQADKGCERMGLEYRYEYPSDASYSQHFDNYKLNNPDIYIQSLCETEAVLCDAWDSRNGSSYFKDPVDMICEWRVEDYLGMGSWNWLKKEVKRCDADGDETINLAAWNGATLTPFDILTHTLGEDDVLQAAEMELCADASDCELTFGTVAWCDNDEVCGTGTCINNECHNSCILDANDYPCAQDNIYPNHPPKTMGEGGPGAEIEQPLGGLEIENSLTGETYNWAAVCPANQDDCTEYIDPESTASFNVDTLEPATLYILDDFPSNNALPSIGDNCSSLEYYELNSDNQLEHMTDIDPGDVFYYVSDLLGDDGECRFTINSSGPFIRKAVVDYQLAHTLDRTTCNGMVDLEQNCTLLNERNRAMEGADGMSHLIYDANADFYASPNIPTMATPGNTNTLLKVTPDRTCNSWLSCRSFIKDETGTDVCYDVGTCKRLDSNGNCSYFAPDSGIGNQMFHSNPPVGSDYIGVGDISNLTGYSKVGYLNNSLRADYYQIGDMRQVGQLANVPNGGFERYDTDMYPVGWTPAEIGAPGHVANVAWERDKFRVINNPVHAQAEGIDYPMDGKAFLKFGAKDNVRSEPIAVADNMEYTLTFYINTKNLAAGNASVSFAEGDIGIIGLNPSVLGSEDWKLKVVRFETNTDEDIRLEFSTNDGDGNVYIDNVQIKPTLNSRLDGASEWQTLQSCRLYPENNSLSCDYYDDGGHRKKGWPGYCLEYDRAPGDPNACLMWYPVDRVKGDGVEEGGGYIDREPLYYCVDRTPTNYTYSDVVVDNTYPPTDDSAQTEELVEDNNFGVQSGGDIDITHRNPYGTDVDTDYPSVANPDFWTLTQLGLGNVESRWLDWDSIHHIRVRHSSPSVYCEGLLSDEWDAYYRFDSDNRGADCGWISDDDNNDCAPWHSPHEGGSPDADDMEWWEWWGTISGFGWLFYSDDEDPPADIIVRDGGLYMRGDDSFEGILTSNVDNWCNHPDYHILEVVIYPNVYFCHDIMQVVTPMGQSQHYSANVYEGSNEEYDCNHNIAGDPYNERCAYMADLAPFGAVSQPGLPEENWALMSNPFMWDSREGIDGKQPLFYEVPDSSLFDEDLPRMGQLLDDGIVKGNLFAKDYGHWIWDHSGSVSQIMGEYRYHPATASAEPVANSEPSVSGMIIVPNGDIRVNQLVNLKFNTSVDENHLPMIMYSVRWGDGTDTSVSGIEMRDRPYLDNPHAMYHIYSEPCGAPGHDCNANGAYNIRITIRDNWRLDNVDNNGLPDHTPFVINVVE